MGPRFCPFITDEGGVGCQDNCMFMGEAGRLLIGACSTIILAGPIIHLLIEETKEINAIKGGAE